MRDAEPAAALTAVANSKGYGVYRIDLSGITDKAALMDRLQDALQFPDGSAATGTP